MARAAWFPMPGMTGSAQRAGPSGPGFSYVPRANGAKDVLILSPHLADVGDILYRRMKENAARKRGSDAPSRHRENVSRTPSARPGPPVRVPAQRRR